MCMLLKLKYTKFGVSNLFFQTLLKESFSWSARPPLLGTGRVNAMVQYRIIIFLSQYKSQHIHIYKIKLCARGLRKSFCMLSMFFLYFF